MFELRGVGDHVGRHPRAGEHGDVLLAVDRVGDRRRIDAGPDVDAPELLERGLELAGGRIKRLEAAGQARVGPGAAARKALARLDRAALVDEVLLLGREDLVAAFDPRNIEQAKLRIIGAWLPVLAAGMSGAKWVAVRVGAGAMA